MIQFQFLAASMFRIGHLIHQVLSNSSMAIEKPKSKEKAIVDGVI